MRFCFIILCHLYLLSRLPLVGSFTQNAFFIPLRYFPLYFKVNALRVSLNLNAALSSFIAASPRLIHHSKTLQKKKKKKKKKKTLPLTCLATKTISVCEPSILIVVVVARAGLFTVRQILEWATYVFIYLFIFTLRYVIAPFRYLSRPLISAALAPALRTCLI